MGSRTPLDHPLAPFVGRLRLHSALDEGDVSALLELPWTPVRRERFGYLAREEDNAKNCHIVLSGAVERHRSTHEGDKQITSFYLPGDPIDLENLFFPTVNEPLQALRVSEFAAIRCALLRELAERRPGIMAAFVRFILVEASIAREWVLNVGRRDSRTRIAHLLCELAIRVEAQGLDPKDTPLPVTQLQIAEATGLTAVHANRVLRSLKAEDLISSRGRTFFLPDWLRIAPQADFSPVYLCLQELPEVIRRRRKLPDERTIQHDIDQ